MIIIIIISIISIITTTTTIIIIDRLHRIQNIGHGVHNWDPTQNKYPL